MFSLTIPVKITAVTTNSEHTKKPLTKLQKRKSPTSDDEEWELVPPDGGWVSIDTLSFFKSISIISFVLDDVDICRDGLY